GAEVRKLSDAQANRLGNALPHRHIVVPQEGCELFAPIARDKRRIRQRPANRACNALYRLITGRMAKTLIVSVKAIQIDQQERERIARGFAAHGFDSQSLVESAVIRKLSEGIGID